MFSIFGPKFSLYPLSCSYHTLKFYRQLNRLVLVAGFISLVISFFLFLRIASFGYDPLLFRTSFPKFLSPLISFSQTFSPVALAYVFSQNLTLRFSMIILPLLLSPLFPIAVGSTSGTIGYIISFILYLAVFNSKLDTFVYLSIPNSLTTLHRNIFLGRITLLQIFATLLLPILLSIFVGLRIHRSSISLDDFSLLYLFDIATSRFDSLTNSLSYFSANLFPSCPSDIVSVRPFHLLAFFLPRFINPDKPLPFNAILSMQNFNVPIVDGTPLITLDFTGYYSSICDIGYLPALFFFFPILGLIMRNLSSTAQHLNNVKFLSQIAVPNRLASTFLLLNFASIPASLLITQLSRNMAEFILDFAFKSFLFILLISGSLHAPLGFLRKSSN